MANVLACCTTIRSTDTRQPTRAMTCRGSSATTTGRARPTPEGLGFTPGELVGCVSGELGLREFLEGAGHELVGDLRQGRPGLGVRARAARTRRW